MAEQPLGLSTGRWDTATGIPDAKTGIPSKEFGYATNCYVYDKKQWTNQVSYMYFSESYELLDQAISDTFIIFTFDSLTPLFTSLYFFPSFRAAWR